MNDWLKIQKEYQQETYGTDIDSMATDVEARTTYTTWNILAAHAELSEALEETPWKPWSSRDKKEMWHKNRDSFVSELVDVAFFLANAAIAAGVSDEEWNEKYQAKMEVNRKRQRTGYDANATKCPNCRRELDKKGAYCVRRTRAVGLKSHFELECVACDHRFTLILDEETELP